VKRIASFAVLIALVFAALLQAASPKMKEALQPYVDREELPGMISVLATKDSVLQMDCIGYSDLETKTPIAPDQGLWIASTSKIFTGTALMMLVDEGKVSLDDPIEKYFPEMANLKVLKYSDDDTVLLKSIKTKPTVRHALSHQIGFPFQTKMMDKFGSDALPLEMEIFEISRTPLSFEPGTGYAYSELGIDIVGGIIEKVSGQKYEDFVQQRIFDPLEMTDTTLWPSEEFQKTRWIHCYQTVDGKLQECDIPMMKRPYESRLTRFPEPGACIFSTANDLLKFFQMHAAGGLYNGKRLISQEAQKEIMAKQTPEGQPYYGLTNMEQGWIGHAGACGNQCYADPAAGIVRLYIVQVSGVPKHDEAVGAWRKTAEEIFRDAGLR
jgi:CubicO group peptidase (beta-lactamase class C family)